MLLSSPHVLSLTKCVFSNYWQETVPIYHLPFWPAYNKRLSALYNTSIKLSGKLSASFKCTLAFLAIKALYIYIVLNCGFGKKMFVLPWFLRLPWGTVHLNIYIYKYIYRAQLRIWKKMFVLPWFLPLPRGKVPLINHFRTYYLSEPRFD